MSLRQNLTLTFALVFLLLGGLGAWHYHALERDGVVRQFKESITAACQPLAVPLAAFARGEIGADGLKAALDASLGGEYYANNWIRIAFALDGRPVYEWMNPRLQDLLSPAFARQAQRIVQRPSMEGFNAMPKPVTLEETVYPQVEPVVLRVSDISGRLFGEARIFAYQRPMLRRIETLRRTYIIGLALLVVFIALMTFLLARKAARPMEEMAGSLDGLRQGLFAEPLPESGLKEVRVMARSFNALQGSLQEKARLDQDLLAAREIQMGLLPKEKLDIEGWEVWGLCLPAREVGGDFYFWHTRKDRVYAGVGDISGKGMRASLLAALSMGSLKTVFRGEEALEESFPVLNDILYHEFKGKGFLCMNAVDLAGGSGRIELVNAGQSYPILIKDHKTLEYWALENGDLPLGAISDVRYRKDPLQLSEGQGLILYSDGGPELKDSNEQLLGFEGFLEILQTAMDHDLEAWGLKAAEAMTAWRGETPQHDDITLLFLRFGRKKWKTTRIL